MYELGKSVGGGGQRQDGKITITELYMYALGKPTGGGGQRPGRQDYHHGMVGSLDQVKIDYF